jgi:hypothetical protein
MEKAMATHKTIRVRGARWDAIEKKAWEFSIKENKVIKPTDVADALLSKFIDQITIEDVKEAMKKR